jgi:DNA-binding winged helix-turn-helix (wHTH) protein/TolB-like protein/lipopolysaccharide biosynthesis regulator YciM
MALETQVLYQFDDFRLNPADHSLLCAGKPIPLTPKSFDILLTLIEKNGQLVTKDELMRKIWPDSFVEEANLTVNVSALRKALGDTTEHQQYIETVPKLGYRFTARVTTRSENPPSLVPVAPPSAEAPAPSEASAVVRLAPVLPKQETKRLSRRIVALCALGFAIVAALLTFWLLRRGPAPRAASEPRRLAILPFRNMKQDAGSDFLGYSLADAVITRLGNVQALRVRPSYAVEKYRDQVVEISKVASDLDVDTLLTGNFIREGDDLRITCQLIDVKTRNLLWKGAFDLRYQKLLTVQDQVAGQIIQGLELNLSSSEAARLKSDEPANPLAYEYYLRGIDLYARNDFPMAIEMLEKSSKIDPNYALTWAYLGRSYTASGSFEFRGRDSYHKAQAAFDRALQLQPTQIDTRVYLANFLTDTGRVEEAVPLLRESLKTNSNHAELHWELGYAYRFAGLLKESVEECERARQLDPGVKINSSALNAYLYLGEYEKFLGSLPTNPELPFHFFYRGFAEYYQKQYDQAVADFDSSFQQDSQLLQAQVGKALSYAIRQQPSKGIEIMRAAENKVRARGVGDSEAIYKLAQAYAVLGDKDSALSMLKHAIDNGFFPYPYFNTDPLLDSLRAERQFNVLMETARSRHEAFQKSFF